MDTAVESQIDIDGRPLVAHVIFRLDVGGMENGLVNLINHLPSDRYRHAIICLTESSDFEQRISVDNATVFELHKREGKDPLFYLRFWRLLRKLKPTILHTRNLGTLDLVLVATLASVPVRVHGEHGWDSSDPLGQSFKYRLLRRICDLAVTEYVAVSKDIAKWLSDVIGIRGRRIKQIYNGVDVDAFHPHGTIAELPFGESCDDLLIIGAVGRMDPIKNFGRLIDAMAQVNERDPGVGQKLRLVLVGEGFQLVELRQKVEALGLQSAAWLPGKRDDIPQLLRSMHLFVLPSRNEGISNTILESMSTALPVIASNVGGNPELVSNGKTGLLIKANDTDAIIAALLFYLYHPLALDSHGRAARDRATGTFGLEVMVQSYAQLYDRLLNGLEPRRIH